jgi:hypothetical protein
VERHRQVADHDVESEGQHGGERAHRPRQRPVAGRDPVSAVGEAA